MLPLLTRRLSRERENLDINTVCSLSHCRCISFAFTEEASTHDRVLLLCGSNTTVCPTGCPNSQCASRGLQVLALILHKLKFSALGYDRTDQASSFDQTQQHYSLAWFSIFVLLCMFLLFPGLGMIIESDGYVKQSVETAPIEGLLGWLYIHLIRRPPVYRFSTVYSTVLKALFIVIARLILVVLQQSIMYQTCD